MKLHSKAIPVLSCVLFLSACGGGGGSEPVAPPIAVNQPPSLTVEAEVSVVEGNLEVAVASGTDPENQSLSYSISGGADSALFSVSNEGEISFVSAADFEAPADSDVDNSYELTLELADSRGGTDSAQIVVTVTNALEGRVVDGPLSGSAVFLDLNNNLIADAGEPTATANAQGYYALPEPADTLGARLVALGGTDIATNIELADLALIADLPANLASAITISPISSVIAGVEGDDAKAAVLAALGINVSLDDFLAMDIWALAEANNDDAKALQRINQQIALIMTTVQSLGQATTQEELRSLAENAADAVAAQITTNGAINLESTSQLVAVVTASLPNTSAVSALVVGAVAENIADINKLLADESANPTSDAAAEFVQATQTTLLSEVADVVSGVSSLVEFVAETAVSNLFGNSDFYNAQVDTDSDGISNLLDNDDDGDGVADGSDAFPLDASETLDSDADQIGNNADLDDDNDGVADELDAFPLNPTESEDFDEDGIGNNADLDNDNDGVADLNDAFPFDSTETLDTDGDQIGNNADTDDDGDGVADVDDFFPLDATRSEESDGALDNGDLLVFKDGGVGSIWDAGINAFDSAINWGECNQDGGAGCPSIGWEVVTDAERGDVLQVSHSAAGNMAGLFFKASQPVNLADYSAGAIEFDIKVVSGDSKITMKLDCVYPCTSGDKSLGVRGDDGWESVTVNVDDLVSQGLILDNIDTGIVIWAAQYTNTVFQIDNVRWEDIDGGGTTVEEPLADDGWVIPSFTGYESPSSYDGYSLTWSDEFSGAEINTDNWGYEIGGSGWGNNELQYHTNRNAYLKDGLLVLRAQQESYGGRSYTSSRLKTQGKQNFKYGRIDVRARLPEGAGIWPALWMLGKNITDVGWPKSGEIDIMEMVGGNSPQDKHPDGDRTTVGTMHWNNNGLNGSYSPVNTGGYRKLSTSLSEEFHVFSIQWDVNGIGWYIDDVRYSFKTINSTQPFREEFFLVMNIAVGGNWPGSPNSSTAFPQRMVVDYVRVFQKN